MIGPFAHCTVAYGSWFSRSRVTALLLAGTAFAVPPSASGVSLGAITQQSGLGQTLRVVIPVTLQDGEEMPAECFRLAPGQGAADGVPDLLFGRVNVERTATGATLVVTTPRPVNDPVVRITIRAGCETSLRREYTLFMDPPAIEAPVAATPSRELLGAPPPEPATSAARRPQRPQARASTRSVQGESTSSTGIDNRDKAAPPKARAAGRANPRPPPAITAAQPRLSVSSGAPGTLQGSLATEADRERARQERANAIEAETAILRQRIVELTAMVERMQAELRAQEAASGAAAPAAKADESPSPPADQAQATAGTAKGAAADVAAGTVKTVAVQPVEDPAASIPWWKQNSLLVPAIAGLPLLIAAVLLWKRRRDSSQDDLWRTHAAPIRPDTLTRGSALRNPSAGVVTADRRTAAAAASRDEGPVAARDAVDALAVSQLSHVTEEARVFMALGHTDRAIEVLQDHIRHLPRSMPAAWLMLLELYHQQDNRPEFRKLADMFHSHFNVRAPLWDEFGDDSALTGGLENFPAIEQKITALWRTPECRPYLEGLLYDNREGRRDGFPLAAYSDILLLLQVLDAPPEIDIDEDLVAAGQLEDRAKATAATRRSPRKPMPPEPTAPHPVQQPIRFEIEAPQDPSPKTP